MTTAQLDAFNKVWALYPKRLGGNPRRAAEAAFVARLKDGIAPSELEDAVRRYARFCTVMGKIGTEYVMQAASFFGPKREGWRDSWDLPKAPSGPKVYLSPSGKLYEVNGKRFRYLDEAEQKNGAFEGRVLSDGSITVFAGGQVYPSREAAEAARP